MRQLTQRSSQLVARRRAHLTQILGEDDVRPKLVQQDLIDLVEAFARREMRGDGAIYVLLRHALEGKSGLADDRQRSHLRRIVALVGAPDEVRAGAEGVGDFGGGGEERDDPEHAGIYRAAAPLELH